MTTLTTMTTMATLTTIAAFDRVIKKPGLISGRGLKLKLFCGIFEQRMNEWQLRIPSNQQRLVSLN